MNQEIKNFSIDDYRHYWLGSVQSDVPPPQNNVALERAFWGAAQD